MAGVLVAVQDAQMRHAMVTTLQGAGYAVLASDNYAQARALALAGRPELVIMDIFLGNESHPAWVVEETWERRGGCLRGVWPALRRVRPVERRLPHASACALIREVHAQPEMAATRFILLTPKTARIDWYGCEDVDVDLYLTAPFQSQELLDLAARVLALEIDP